MATLSSPQTKTAQIGPFRLEAEGCNLPAFVVLEILGDPHAHREERCVEFFSCAPTGFLGGWHHIRPRAVLGFRPRSDPKKGLKKDLLSQFSQKIEPNKYDIKWSPCSSFFQMCTEFFRESCPRLCSSQKQAGDASSGLLERSARSAARWGPHAAPIQGTPEHKLLARSPAAQPSISKMALGAQGEHLTQCARGTTINIPYGTVRDQRGPRGISKIMK